MKAKLSRWGNSLAVRLPAEIVRELGLCEGQVVELTANNANLEIAPPAQGRRYAGGVPIYTIEELLADMDGLGPEAVPPLVEWGPDRGAEIIDDVSFPETPASRASLNDGPAEGR